LLAKDYEAYEYLPNSIQIYPNQEKLVELLVKAGWQKVSYENIFGGVVSIHQAEK
jgi:ubiquinone/menaquinone biosynthesis C-methylase UbiE